ncbi:MAG: ester cyclase [Anaerolineaceae bacterium]|nr:ester cyclase [Anaerolineaceae bacterium]
MKKYLSVIPLVFLLCFVGGCQDKAAMAELEEFRAKAMAEEQNNAKLMNVVKKIQEAMDNHDSIAIAQCYAEDATMVMPGEPEPVRGREAIAKNQEVFFRAMPDVNVKFITLLSGNHIVFEGTTEGTFTGPMTTPAGDIPPTGKSAKFKFVFIAKVNADGLIEEDRTYYDTADFMRQLGIID